MMIYIMFLIGTVVSWVHIPSKYNMKKFQIKNAIAMVSISDLEIIFDPTNDDINALRTVAKKLVGEIFEAKKRINANYAWDAKNTLVEANNEIEIKSRALIEAKNALIEAKDKEIRHRAEIAEWEKNILRFYQTSLHATMRRDVIECVESFHMTMKSGSRLDKWKHYLTNDSTGIAVLTRVEKFVPQWTQGSSQTQKADYFAKKIVDMFSLGFNLPHDKTAKATIISSDTYYSVQAMSVIECICTVLGIGFAVTP
mmetsp:Transcript_26891/g.37066  ORF Transcript_26891/g.37066 Transcript_26891/m.37066 type:complete len:255 (+) Transcript_26891:16-780(+)